MIDDWTAGTRVLLTPSVAPALVVIADDDTLARHLAEAAAEPEAADTPVEVRETVTGPTRVAGELVAEIVFIVGQLGLGAAGNGVWVAVEHLWQRVIRSRRRAAVDPPEQMTVITKITVVVPTRDGEARVESVTVGPHDGAEVHRSLGKIVEAVLADERADA